YEITKNRINLDTGLVFGGKLTVLQLPEKKFYSLPKQHESHGITIKDENAQRRAKRFKGSLPVVVYADGHVYEFQTIDYSEFKTKKHSQFGVLMFDTQNIDKQVLQKGQLIKGIIGDNRFESIEFEGEVLRCDKKSVGIFYAITFITTDEMIIDNN
ncbi:hypothetical protein OAB57_04130, partial [Bacteriovoracaceae bacterium]|nr:hypothetical protein [Bacteriovoracaceae bacterium]